MDKHRKYRYIAAFCMLGAGVFVFFVLNICMGSVEISVREMMRAFDRGGRYGNQTADSVGHPGSRGPWRL